MTTMRGIRTVARQEFRVRVRTARWRRALTVWFVVLAGFTGAVRAAIGPTDDPARVQPGAAVFGALILVVLVLSMLVVPALAAPSVGDRENVLGTLPTAPLAPAEIVLGKLTGAWLSALILLLAALPVIGSTMLMGGVGARQAAVALGVLALLLGVVSALAQCLSALVARKTTAIALSYLAVFGLLIGSPVAYVLALDTTQANTWEGTDTTKVWWLLAPNPIAILADATPRGRPRVDPSTNIFYTYEQGNDLFTQIRDEVRDTRTIRDEKYDYTPYLYGPRKTNTYLEAPPVWPFGLAFDLALGAGAVLVAVRRLRTATTEPVVASRH